MYVDRVVNAGGRVLEVARGELMEVGHRAKWWNVVKKMAEKLEMQGVVDLIWLKRMSLRSRRELAMKEETEKSGEPKGREVRKGQVGKGCW